MPLIPRLISAAAALRGDARHDVPTIPATDPSVAPVADIRADGWQNAVSGLGVAGTDKAIGMTFASSDAVSRPVLSDLYRFDGIAAKIVDLPVWDSVRNGWSIELAEADSELSKALDESLAPLDERNVYTEARKWARLYGGAIVIAGLDDVADGDLSQPVDRYGKLKWLEVVAGGYAGPVYAERNDPGDKSRVTMWVVNPQGSETAVRRVHPDRVYVVHGVPMPAEVHGSLGGWDDSVIQRCWTALSRVATADGTGVTFLSERQYPVWKIKNLKALLAGKNGGLVAPRFQAMSVAKSIYKAIILDMGNEEFDVTETSASGISELLDIYPNRVAAVSNIPVTRLYGTSPGGMNATGESDIRGYYDYIEGGEQAVHLDPFLRWTTELVMGGDEGPTRGELVPYSVKFVPLYSPTAAEEATTRATNATADNTYVMAGVLTTDEVRQSRFGGTEYGADITLDDHATPAPSPNQGTPS